MNLTQNPNWAKIQIHIVPNKKLRAIDYNIHITGWECQVRFAGTE